MENCKIPKIIHYCWYGNKEYPEIVKKCIESWTQKLPGWKIMLWNEDNSPINQNHPYLLKAIKNKQYAFAADYMRCYILHEYGGVYFDTDVEVVRDFEPLLQLSGFLAPENCAGDLYNVAVFGMKKNHVFCQDMMNYYNHLSDFEPIPDVVSKLLKKEDYDISILNRITFYPYNPFDHDQKIKQLFACDIVDETYAIHHWVGSWKPTFSARIKNFIKHKLDNKQ